jgi:transcriptional antiterminator
MDLFRINNGLTKISIKRCALLSPEIVFFLMNNFKQLKILNLAGYYIFYAFYCEQEIVN